MFGLDDGIAQLSDGSRVGVVLAIAILLGLRHAGDPDHLAAVTVLVTGEGGRRRRLAARLGSAWGLGHATSLVAFGLPIVLAKAYLPDAAQRTAETAVGVVIGVLAIWLLVRWRRGVFHLHLHAHGDPPRPHVHLHAAPGGHAHEGGVSVRSPRQAYGIGLLHGAGGSAGVGVLLLATIHSRPLAVGALLLFALFTAVSMTLLSTGLGAALATERVAGSLHHVVPALGVASLAFGTWYALGALSLVPYVL
jgi:ABC-type nickel/cobalt efflux system permease component RcnA